MGSVKRCSCHHKRAAHYGGAANCRMCDCREFGVERCNSNGGPSMGGGHQCSCNRARGHDEGDRAASDLTHGCRCGTRWTGEVKTTLNGWDHEPTAGELGLCQRTTELTDGRYFTVKLRFDEINDMEAAAAVAGRSLLEQIVYGAVQYARFDNAREWAKQYEGRPYWHTPDPEDAQILRHEER